MKETKGQKIRRLARETELAVIDKLFIPYENWGGKSLFMDADYLREQLDNLSVDEFNALLRVALDDNKTFIVNGKSRKYTDERDVFDYYQFHKYNNAEDLNIYLALVEFRIIIAQYLESISTLDNMLNKWSHLVEELWDSESDQIIDLYVEKNIFQRDEISFIKVDFVMNQVRRYLNNIRDNKMFLSFREVKNLVNYNLKLNKYQDYILE